MERYITDVIYTHTTTQKSNELEIRERKLYAKLSSHISEEEYLQIEEELNSFFDELGKELFCRGFTEGVHFLLECL
jgi:hypothetical protein